MLPNDYQARVDQLTPKQWYELLPQFLDASIYQAHAYGPVRWGESQLSHFSLEKGGEVLAMAQLRIVQIPLIKGGIAYLRWGPLWQRKDRPADPEVLRAMLIALQKEYCSGRGLLLRILPNMPEAFHQSCESIFEELGFQRKGALYRTILLNLEPPEEELRANTTKRWRRQLNNAAKNDLHIEAADDDRGFGEFQTLFDEMVSRKGFEPGMDPKDFRKMQPLLPEGQRLKLMLCRSKGQAIAAIFCGIGGNTAIYLMGATGDEGLKLRGSYALHWEMISWLKSQGITWYDLNGYNPDLNPGTATFKEGFSGLDTRYLGPYEYSSSTISRMAVSVMETIRR